MTWRRLFILVGIAAAIGFSVFGLMVYRATEIDRVPAVVSDSRFLAIQDSLALAPPIFTTVDGGLARRPLPTSPPDHRPSSLHVLVYRSAQEGLVHTRVPFWFIRLKMPALRFALRETGVDFENFAITRGELARYGPSVVYAENHLSGDRVLIWTQ